MKKRFEKNNLSENVKNIVFYPPIKKYTAWSIETYKDNLYFVLDIPRGFKKKFKITVISKDAILVKPIFSVFDIMHLFLIVFMLFLFIVSRVFLHDLVLDIMSSIIFSLLGINYSLFYPYCWRTIKNSIRYLY